MATSAMLAAVKVRLGITDEYHDAALMGYIDDVEAFLEAGGVPAALIESDGLGAVARGVADLWAYGAGGGEFSEAFLMRARQLALTPQEEESE